MPSFETLRAIVDNTTTNINPEWLLTGSGEMQKIIYKEINESKSTEKRLDKQYVTLYDINAAANLKTLLGDKNTKYI